jgi:CrcB protein
LALAGAAGAAARYLVDFWIVSRRTSRIPLGTFAVNASGSFAAGLLSGLAAAHALPPAIGVVLGSGFLGAYTTFSTWLYEAARLVEEGEWRAAAISVLGGLLAAAVLGLALGAAL